MSSGRIFYDDNSCSTVQLVCNLWMYIIPVTLPVYRPRFPRYVIAIAFLNQLLFVGRLDDPLQ